MFTIQVDETFQQIISKFYQIGIWQSDDESNIRKTGKKWFYTCFGSLYPIFILTNAFLCADRDESMFSVQLAIITAIVYVKFLYLLFKNQDILAFLNDPPVVHSNREEYEKASKMMKRFLKFVRPYIWMIFLTVILLIVIRLPILSADKGLPLYISFSWNDSEIIYWLAYSFLSLSSFLYFISNLVTPLIWYIMLRYSIEYGLLGNRLRNLGVEKKIIEKKGKNQKIFKLMQRSAYVEDLIVLIKAHRNLTE